MPYCNDNMTTKQPSVPKKMTLSNAIDEQRNITMDQCVVVSRIINVLTGGELPPPPEEGQRDVFSRLQQLDSLNKLLLEGIRAIADSLGVDVC